MVTIKAIGGLANRMRVIDSAYQLVNSTGNSILLIWEMSYELNCSFFKLFEPVKHIQVREYHKGYYLHKMNDFIVKSSKKVGIDLPLGYNAYISDDDVIKAVNSNSLGKLIPETKEIYIRTVERFYYGSSNSSILLPVKSLREEIHSVQQSFNSNTIGIHIRRTDHLRSINHSPTEAFAACIIKEIESDPTVNFFLTTDSNKEERFFKRIFGSRIITYDKEFNRNSEKGIQDALVDLYCLANTKKIIGSYYSSFSEMAAQIKGIPIDIVNEH